MPAPLPGDNPQAYIPGDRRRALARGEDLPRQSRGAAMFVDISGFTSLTEALARELGGRRGAEELTATLQRVVRGPARAAAHLARAASSTSAATP